MRVQDVMTKNPVCCTASATIQEAATKMAECDCGELPVIQGNDDHKVIGVVTDRDIACRAVAGGKDPRTPVRDVMSSPVVCVTPETELEEDCRKIEVNQVRRIPVLTVQGACCGIVSQADIARSLPDRKTAEVLRDVSKPSRTSSAIAQG